MSRARVERALGLPVRLVPVQSREAGTWVWAGADLVLFVSLVTGDRWAFSLTSRDATWRGVVRGMIHSYAASKVPEAVRRQGGPEFVLT